MQQIPVENIKFIGSSGQGRKKKRLFGKNKHSI